MQDTTPRFDMYRLIHKGLRAAMADTLAAAGRMDTLDDDDTASTLARVRALLALCRSHLTHENDFIHTALAARRPGSTAHVAHEHAQHERALAALEAHAVQVEAARGPARADAAAHLYRALTLFVAENFAHMAVEETEINQALWSAFSDAELIAIHDALVASIPPAEMGEALRWMIPNVAPFERAVLLGDVQRKAPAEVFSALLEDVRLQLSARDWDKLMYSLAPLPMAA